MKIILDNTRFRDFKLTDEERVNPVLVRMVEILLANNYKFNGLCVVEVPPGTHYRIAVGTDGYEIVVMRDNLEWKVAT